MRRKIKSKIKIKPEPVYNSLSLEKFTNYLMRKGKKFLARKILYQALEEVKKQTKGNPVEIFEKAVENASPLLTVQSRRVGGATYQVPKEIQANKRMGMGMRWIIDAAKSKKGKNMIERLSEEIIAASKNEGAAIKKKEDARKMAEANRAFAHFSW